MTLYGRPPDILVYSSDPAQLDALASMIEEQVYRVKRAATEEEALTIFYSGALTCVVLHYEGAPAWRTDFLKLFKSSNVFGFTPLLLLFDSATDALEMNWDEIAADDFVCLPVEGDVLRSRIRLSRARAHRDVNANPLTGLPGNLPILREAERRLRSNSPFALGHFDINHFKAYNDKYGFHRGDEVLRMTARILESTLYELHNPSAYVGHVGGDDYILMLPCEQIDRACSAICREFDSISKNFYDEDDRKLGYIMSVDRKDQPMRFPLMSCSIGLVDTSSSSVSHIADLSTRAAQVKRFAKTMAGSNYVTDRRG